MLLLSGQREGAQLYQQEPSVPALALGNECLDGELSQEMNSPVETGTGHDHSFHPPLWFASVSCINFPQPGTLAFLERGNQPEMLSKSARYAMVQWAGEHHQTQSPAAA